MVRRKKVKKADGDKKGKEEEVVVNDKTADRAI